MFSKTAVFRMNTRVVSGEGEALNIGAYVRELGGSKVLIVTDKGIMDAGLLSDIQDKLSEAGIDFKVFSDVLPNPPTNVVAQGAEVAAMVNADLLLAVGGGSSIDTAKAVNVVYTHGGNIKDYAGIGKINKPTLPLIAIPTTCGTGSEVTWSSVITDEEDQFKFAVFSGDLIPELAIIDPGLMKDLPPALIASTGLDALTHAIEAYVSAQAQPMSDAFAIYAIELIVNNLRSAVHYQDNLKYIGNMAIASTMAGAAFTNGSLGLVHAMAHPLGGVFDIAHGIANAILLPYVMKFNLVANPGKFADIAAAMGESIEGLHELQAAERALHAVQSLSLDVGIPTNLKDVGMTLDKLDKVAADAMRSKNVFSNPRRNTLQDIKKLFEDAYYGNL